MSATANQIAEALKILEAAKARAAAADKRRPAKRVTAIALDANGNELYRFETTGIRAARKAIGGDVADVMLAK